METAVPRASDRPRREAIVDALRVRTLRAELGPLVAGTVLPFVLVVYLALRGGGYDAVVRSEIGIAVWWIVLLGAIIGVLPSARLSRSAWTGLGILCLFAAWVGLAITWSESAERSVAELARVGTYVGVLALALTVQGRDGLRRTVYSIAAALALVAGLALLSRLHPAWFPANETGAAFENGRARLNYPVNYWNALATMMAIGMPLLLAVASQARRLSVRALATAFVPILALVAFYTFSRGGVIAVAAALVAFVALFPRRLHALPALLLGTLGSTLLIVAATQRNALKDGLASASAAAQADEMIAIVLVVCAGVALLSAAVGLATRHGLVSVPRPSRRATGAGFAVTIAVVVVAALAAGLPDTLSDRWTEFKQPVGPEAGNTAGRFESASGNGRYQYWETAVDAFTTDPLKGIGPGTYEYYWAREGPIPGFVRDAHSLFLETAAELGVIGLLILAAFFAWMIGLGARRAFSAKPEARPWFAAATAACFAFVVAASNDWTWEVAAIPVVFMLLAGAVLAARGDDTSEDASHDVSGSAPRIGIAVLALAGTITIGVPLLGAKDIRASQENVDAGLLPAALTEAEQAGDREPWAATPDLQQALVLELQGELDTAAAGARAATEDEPTNWRPWYVLSRIEGTRGETAAAADAHEQARRLNPRSSLFAE